MAQQTSQVGNGGRRTGGHGFPRSRRLLTPSQYRAVFDCGRHSGDRHASLFVGANDRPLARLGLAVSKRVARRAVVRNRIKRIIRESFRHRQTALKGKDVVVVAKVASSTASTKALRQAVDRMLERVAKTP